MGFCKKNTLAHTKIILNSMSIIKILEFFIDSIFGVFGMTISQQISGIPMGTNYTPSLVDIFKVFFVGRPFCCCVVFSFFFYFFPPSAFCDFSAIFHLISLIFGQSIDTNLLFSWIHLWMRRSKVKVTRWHSMKMHSQQKMWSVLESANGTI